MKATELTREALVDGLIITTNTNSLVFKVTRVTEKSFFAATSTDGKTFSKESRYGIVAGVKWFNSIKF